MPFIVLTPGLTGPLAMSTVSASIACGFLMARAANRRARRRAREQQAAFVVCIDEFVAGRSRGRELRQRAAALEPEVFWNAIEAAWTRHTLRARRDLEQALERSRHISAERRALRSDTPWRRELAAQRLARVGAHLHRTPLRRAMVAGPEMVTVAAARALGARRDGGALRWLLDHSEATANRSPRARLAMLESFGPGACGRLQAALERGLPDPRLERAVVDALGRWRHTAAAPAIAARLGSDWRDLRTAAARALGALGAAEHGAALIDVLGDPEWQVRAQSARALGILGVSAAIPALAEATHDSAWWVRRHAAYALGALGEGGRETLRRLAAQDADPYARDIAQEALSGGFPGGRPPA